MFPEGIPSVTGRSKESLTAAYVGGNKSGKMLFASSSWQRALSSISMHHTTATQTQTHKGVRTFLCCLIPLFADVHLLHSRMRIPRNSENLNYAVWIRNSEVTRMTSSGTVASSILHVSQSLESVNFFWPVWVASVNSPSTPSLRSTRLEGGIFRHSLARTQQRR